MENPKTAEARGLSANRTEILYSVPVLCYNHSTTIKDGGSAETMGIEVNFHLGEKPLNIDTGLALDPRIVALVQLLARRAADEDFEAAINK